jgi:hypothetical protein
MFTLTDLRVLLRETAPAHRFDEEQRLRAERLLGNLEKQVGSLRQELLAGEEASPGKGAG